jgi:hypothetical protein
VKKKTSHPVYFAGERAGFARLLGHAGLAEAVYEKSHGKYLCRLPQDFAPRGRQPRLVRDHHLRTLLECDAGLFCLDDAGPDDGTAAEFMFAKFADLPAVVLCDAAAGSGPRRAPRGRLTDFYPRTATLALDSLHAYRALQHRRARGRRAALDEVVRLAGQHASATAAVLCDQVATAVVRALDKVIAEEPAMPRHLREEIYNWLALMPGLRGKEKALRKEFERLLAAKVKKGLL